MASQTITSDKLIKDLAALEWLLLANDFFFYKMTKFCTRQKLDNLISDKINK